MPKFSVTITKTYEINADTRSSAIDFVRNNESVITPTFVIKNAVVVGSELLPSVTPSVSLTDLPTDFATKVKVSGDDHWVWVGRNASFRSSAGHKITYGKYSVPKQNKRYFAHRYAYDQLLGAITNKTLLVNHCGNTLCVNPTHWGKKTNLLERGVCSQGHYQNDKVTTYTIKGRPACRKCQVNGNAKNKGRGTIPFPPETPVN